MSVTITLSDVVKVFGAGPGATRAVDGVTLEIGRGELFFLLGPSGCGKTTLLRMIAGFIDPTGGRIRFGDRDVTHLPPNKRNTGMVFQSYALWPHMTVDANVAFGLTVRKIPADQRRKRVREALEAVRMGEYGHRKPNELSGGQQQRVALARALVVRPDVLLLDEPLSNLDAKLRVDLRSEIRRICKEAGITSVYVTHDQKEALSMADRIAIMRSGRVEQTGPPVDLYRAPASRFVAEFLGETNFLEGTIVEAGGRTVTVQTGAGNLVAAAIESKPVARSARVLCSLRPESLRIGQPGAAPFGPNSLRGKVVETTYLGELAQHVVECGGERFKVAELNPHAASVRAGRNGDHVTLGIAPEDVAIIPEQ